MIVNIIYKSSKKQKLTTNKKTSQTLLPQFRPRECHLYVGNGRAIKEIKRTSLPYSHTHTHTRHWRDYGNKWQMAKPSQRKTQTGAARLQQKRAIKSMLLMYEFIESYAHKINTHFARVFIFPPFSRPLLALPVDTFHTPSMPPSGSVRLFL